MRIKLQKLAGSIGSTLKRLEARGKTVLPVAFDGRFVGVVSVADRLRRESAPTVAALRTAGISRIVMLTGDNPAVAAGIAEAAGVTEVLASKSPEEKVKAVKTLLEEGRKVAMVGDGVNDAPVLASASVGIVMGAMGSDVAIDAADVALMSDDISRLPFLVALSRKTRNRILFNIWFSMVINFGAIVLAGLGRLNPVTAALVHNVGSVFVVVNSALLLTYRPAPIPRDKMPSSIGELA